LDTIDLDAAERAQVAVRGINDYCIDEVADHCLALLLALTRSIRECDSAIKKGAWPPPHDFPALEPLGGKTIGLIGFGQIARAVARRLQAFGCRVCAHDPNVNSTVLDEHGVESVSFEEVLNSDVISLHVPAQPGSASLLSVREFARVKPGAILLNVSRGSLIDEEALVTALDSGAIAAAGLDVFVQESGNASKLALHPRVVATPHVAYYSPASLIKLRRRAAEVLVAELEKVE
jgi:D-3-phosphoglycerate dehydrogenase